MVALRAPRSRAPRTLTRSIVLNLPNHRVLSLSKDGLRQAQTTAVSASLLHFREAPTVTKKIDETTSEDDLAGLSYEAARAQLIEVVSQLESGGVPLDESLALWERGERLARVCQQWLDGAQAKIDAARADHDDS
jgi:exodeoxyribonuclease VII small subunit